jgi:hypothetical protein
MTWIHEVLRITAELLSPSDPRVLWRDSSESEGEPDRRRHNDYHQDQQQSPCPPRDCDGADALGDAQISGRDVKLVSIPSSPAANSARPAVGSASSLFLFLRDAPIAVRSRRLRTTWQAPYAISASARSTYVRLDLQRSAAPLRHPSDPLSGCQKRRGKGRPHRQSRGPRLLCWPLTPIRASFWTGPRAYPGGGGQPPDHGVLLCGNVRARIVGTRKGGDLYLLPAEGDLPRWAQASTTSAAPADKSSISHRRTSDSEALMKSWAGTV